MTTEKDEKKRKESRIEVQTYLARLKLALASKTVNINIQKTKQVDIGRNKRYTNRFTLGDLFPDEDESIALKRELSRLTVGEYKETVRDNRYPKLSEMRVFGKKYGKDDVYIKIRVELIDAAMTGRTNYIFVMSFHYSDRVFKKNDFPYG